MIDSPSLALAFAAGFVSFVSPCCLPLVPGYLAVVSGSPVQGEESRFDVAPLGRSLAFVASFSAVFIILGLGATALGALLLSAVGFGAAQRSFGWVKRHYAELQVGAGLVLVVMGGLVFTNELFRLNIEIQKALSELGLNFFQSV